MSRANHQDRSEELPKEIPVSAQIHALIENIKKAIQNRDKQQLKENLAQLSEFFRINTAKESLEAHNRRIYNILRLMAENYHAPWEVFMEVSEIVRDKKGNVIETTDTQRRPTIESILAMEHSHGEVKIGPMTLPAVAHREAELLKIYGVEIWEIARILNM